MELDKKEKDCCTYIEVNQNGSFKLSGSEDFVNREYRKLIKNLGISNQNLSEERKYIGLALTILSIVFIGFPFTILTGFLTSPFNDSTILKIILIFGSGLLGSVFRVIFIGKDKEADKTKKDLYIAYYFIYPVVILAVSFLVFSLFSNTKDLEFYSATLPIIFIAGILGLRVLDKIKI